MWPKLALIVLLGFGPATLKLQAETVAVSLSSAAKASAEGAPIFVCLAKSDLCGELAMLDGGALSQALPQALSRGVHIRLVLDPAERCTRDQGRALQTMAQSASPTALALELRWLAGAAKGQRHLWIEGKRLLKWKAGEEPVRDDTAQATFMHRFEKTWNEASVNLPEGQTLEDDLRALPDPREKEPRFVRRRDARGE